MKHIVCALLVVSCILNAAGQEGDDHGRRGFGNTRGGTTAESSNGGHVGGPTRSENSGVQESLPLPPPPAPAPPPPSPPPPVQDPVTTDGPSETIIYNPVVIVSLPGEGDDTPSVIAAVLHDRRSSPESSGYDFSEESVISWNDPCVDLYFEGLDSGQVMRTGADADIRPVGVSTDAFWDAVLPAVDWSEDHSVSLSRGHSYLLWSWDNQYFVFNVTELTADRVAFEWVMLKAGSGQASRCPERDGLAHREEGGDKFFR